MRVLIGVGKPDTGATGAFGVAQGLLLSVGQIAIRRIRNYEASN